MRTDAVTTAVGNAIDGTLTKGWRCKTELSRYHHNTTAPEAAKAAMTRITFSVLREIFIAMIFLATNVRARVA